MTSILKICLGIKGNYKVFGYNIELKDDKTQENEIYSSKARNLTRQVVHSITGTYIHTLTHELAHAAVCKLLADTPFTPTPKSKLNITVYTNGNGDTNMPESIRFLGKTRNAIVRVAGPTAGIAFSGLELLGGLILKNKNRYAAIPLITTGTIGLINEITYCITSSYNKDDGDFGVISKDYGKAHLIRAGSAIITECVLIGAAALFIIKRSNQINASEINKKSIIT